MVKTVYQFKIRLDGTRPVIWRRVQVPSTYTFGDLHAVIQRSMGWSCSHMHQFFVNDPKTGTKLTIGPSYYFHDISDIKVLKEDKEKLSKYFTMKNKVATYEYDFGDSWIHIIILEKILPANKNVLYPVCVGGKCACPPEDVGGVDGYYGFLEILNNPKHPEHEDMKEWLLTTNAADNVPFDPKFFNHNSVEFY